ncbi:helix-turn-helix domain-containing protein [Fructilactobacillus sp. Tb1]|uniref:helix-turn-helix domain-containing protein n=1 Tax=Fructilactobacillus sp. Tb1 TaxID=3422304 RepID=UPI003D2E8225
MRKRDVMNFTDVLKTKRTDQKLTQQQLADKMMISSKTISNWENGKTLPDLDNLIQLSKILNISLDYLLSEDTRLSEDMRKSAELKETKKLINWTTITDILFLAIEISLYFSHVESIIVIILTNLALFSNLFLEIWLVNKYKKLENE